VTLTVTVTATVTQDGTRSTADVVDNKWPAELRFGALLQRDPPGISVARSGRRGSLGQERSEDYFDLEAECRPAALGSVADGAAAFGGALSHRADVG